MRIVLAALVVLATGTVAVFANVARADECADPRLSDAAAALITSPSEPTPAALVDAARLAGSNAVALRMVRAQGGASALAELVAESPGDEGRFTICGEAESEGVVLRIVGREGARLSATLTGDGLVVDVALSADGMRASLEVRAADGTTFRRELDRRTLRVPLPNGFRAPFIAQVVATTSAGPRPVASLGYGAMTTSDGALDSDDDLDVHVARLRRLVSVPEVRANVILGRVATAHATAVCREGRATHVVDEGDPVRRVRRAGLEARSIGEVVARADGMRTAIAALDASPSHRIALEDEIYTDYGAGHATSEDGHVCVVVVLAAWPRFAGR